MTTRKPSHASTKNAANDPAVATDTTHAAAPEVAATSASSTSASPVVPVQAPPADTIPSVPEGAAQPNGSNYAKYRPRQTELAVFANAATDLGRMTEFDTVFGVTGLAQAHVVQSFEVAGDWSTMVLKASAWLAHAKIMEGLAWSGVRSTMIQLAPLFDAAARNKASLLLSYPSFAGLLTAKKEISKGAATRQANKAAIAAGEAPNHGLVGKRRERVAARKALAASKAPQPTTTVPTPSTGTTTR